MLAPYVSTAYPTKTEYRKQPQMKLLKLLPILPLLLAASTAHAATMVYEDNVTTVFGTGGNPDGSYVSSITADGVNKASVRFRERFTTNMNNDGLGTYQFALGTSVNFDFSTITTADNLSGKSFSLRLDTDPGPGQTWLTVDPSTLYIDNAFGDNGVTPSNGAGPLQTGTYAMFGGTYDTMQNSQNVSWYGINTNIAGTYDLEYSFSDTQGSRNEQSIAGARLQIGAPASSVPDSGSSLALGGIAFGLLGAAKRRFGR